jgi:hypothetical protein
MIIFAVCPGLNHSLVARAESEDDEAKDQLSRVGPGSTRIPMNSGSSNRVAGG